MYFCISDDEHTRKIGKLQDILQNLEDNNFEESLDWITGIGFTSYHLTCDLARNIMRFSHCFPQKISLFVRLVKEISKICDILANFECLVEFGCSIEAQPFLLSLIHEKLLSRSHRSRLKPKKHKIHPLQEIIKQDKVDDLQEFCSSPNFSINHKVLFQVPKIYEPYGTEILYSIEYSALCGSAKCFRYLYINGALNDVNKFKILKYAIASNNIEIMELIEQSNVRPSKSDIEFAIWFHRNEIFDWINEQIEFSNFQILLKSEFIHGFSKSQPINMQEAFDTSCANGLTYMAKWIVANATVKQGNSLYLACENGHERIVKLLMSLPKINLNSFFEWKTPLYISCLKGHTNIVKLLISSPNIDINLTFNFYDLHKDKGTPLYAACLNNHIDIVNILLSIPSIDVNKGDLLFLYKLIVLHFMLLVIRVTSILLRYFYRTNQSMSTTTELEYFSLCY